MADRIKILVVEDDDDQWQTYQDTAVDFNKEEIQIELARYTSAVDAEEAQESLMKHQVTKCY